MDVKAQDQLPQKWNGDIWYGKGGTRFSGNLLNCKVGMMPITYLRFPISDRYIGIQAFRGLTTKIRNKQQPWKGENNVISEPTYLMGMLHFKRRNT